MNKKAVAAAEAGNVSSLTDVNIRDTKGRTRLFAASGSGQMEAVSKLLRKGAKVNSKDRKRWTPLHNAAHHGHADIVEVLLKAGGDKDRVNIRGTTPLMLACRQAHVDTAELLVNSGCSITSKDMFGRQALHWAIKGGDLELVKFLIAKEADISAADNWGKTPVFQAAKSNRPLILGHLLSLGADTSGSDRNGRQAIHAAAEKNSSSAIRCLVRSGINPDKPLVSGRTPLMDATYNCHVSSVRVLLTSGASINAVDKKGSSALHHSLYARILSRRQQPWFDLVLLLLQENADIDLLTQHTIFAVHKEPHHPQNAMELSLKGGVTHYVKAFIRCGSDLGNVRSYMKMKTKELTQYVSKNSRTLDLIKRTYKHPHQLKVLARKKFRMCMPSVKFSDEFNKMALAPGLRRFVMYEDLEELREDGGMTVGKSLCESHPEKEANADSDSGLDYEPSVFDSNDHLDKIAVDSD